MAQNFKAWSVIDAETGDFVVAILERPNFVGLPDIPDFFRKRAHGHAKLIEGIPSDAWMRWSGNKWQARRGKQPEAAEATEI